MTISKEQIRKLIEDAKKKGYMIGVRDVAFVVLIDVFEDEDLTYKCLFGSDKDFTQEYARTYAGTSAITFIRDYISTNLEESKKRGRKKDGEDISFDENKAYMLKLKKDTEKAMEDGDIEKKDGLKILADISVKLNDKFNVRDADEGRQTVIVNQKFNDVCSCGKEISRRPITKEEAMELYDLVEKES